MELNAFDITLSRSSGGHLDKMGEQQFPIIYSTHFRPYSTAIGCNTLALISKGLRPPKEPFMFACKSFIWGGFLCLLGTKASLFVHLWLLDLQVHEASAGDSGVPPLADSSASDLEKLCSGSGSA